MTNFATPASAEPTEPISSTPASPPMAEAIVAPWALLGMGALALVGSVIDPLLTKSTFDQVLNDGTKILGIIDTSWLVAIGIFFTSIAAPIKAGHERASGKSATGFMIGWALLGIAMFCIRWFDKVLITGDLTSFTQEGGWVTSLPIALLIGGVYVLTGLGFRSISYKHFSSPWHTVRPALTRASKATEKAIKAKGVARHAEAALDTNINQLTLVAHEYDTHLTRLRNAEAEIKDRVRAALTAHMADPAEAGLMFAPHQGSNATEAPANH